MTFTDLGLSPEVLKAVGEAGYVEPTPIQAKAIPYVLMGRDILGCAQTGTGKTASFTLPMIDILASGRARARMPRSLILEPTRELAAQVAESFDVYGKNNKLSQALLIGGSSIAQQEKKLDRGVDVLIATPGRLLDLFERGKILLADVKILVIDESDRMLDMGFIPDVERIVRLLPKIRQTLFFSATMPPEIRRLADVFLMNPKEIAVSPPSSAAETVAQSLVKVAGERKDKRAALRSLLRSEDVASALIFCNRKRDVDILFRSLKKHQFSAAALHGDMAQPVRMETLARFKTARSICWSVPMWRRAASICRRSPTFSISTSPSTPRTTSTASAAPGAPGVRAGPSPWRCPRSPGHSPRSATCSANRFRSLKPATARPGPRPISRSAPDAGAAANANPRTGHDPPSPCQSPREPTPNPPSRSRRSR